MFNHHMSTISGSQNGSKQNLLKSAFIHESAEHFKSKVFLTIQDVAQLLDCPEQVVYHWTRRADPKRRPPRLIVGKSIRFPKSTFLLWLADEQISMTE